MQRWRQRIMGATADIDRRWRIRVQERRQQGLQHQSATARTADGEVVLPALDLAGYKFQRLRTNGCRADIGAAHGCGSLHRDQMLAHQARLGTPGADICNAKGLSCNHGQGQGSAQDLAATLSVSAVQFNHVLHCSILILSKILAASP